MINRKLASLGLAAALGLTACADDGPAPTATLPSSSQPAAARKAEAAPTPTGKHFVFRKGTGVPADLIQRVEALGGRVEAVFDASGFALVDGLNDAGVAELRRFRDVSSVEADFAFRLDVPARSEAAVLENAAPESALAAPAPARYAGRQWNYPAIGANRAWAAGKNGSRSVRVAILDTGIDYTFPDLMPLVDHANSASFIPGDEAVRDTFFPGRADLKPYIDLHGHGTHVASTVASRGAVVAGVTSETSLMAVKVLSANGSSSGGSVAQGLLFAVERGAHVVNMSLGGAFLKAGGGGVGAIHRLLNYARSRGVTVVVAAGNDGADLDHSLYPTNTGEMARFPSAYAAYCDAPNVICVSATGPVDAGKGSSILNPTHFAGPFSDVDEPAAYTNYGRSAINVAAPGGNYRFTSATTYTAGFVWQACSKFTLVSDPQGRILGRNVCAANPQFDLPMGFVGTSMAAPHVAGLAALLVADGVTHPAQIRSRIQQSADDLGAPGTDPYYGKGRINVARALGVG